MDKKIVFFWKKFKFFIIGIFVCLLGIIYSFFYTDKIDNGIIIEDSPLIKSENLVTNNSILTSNQAVKPLPNITVHIAGAVKRPGVYLVSANILLFEILKQAIALPEANLNEINLAQSLKNQQKIFIPFNNNNDQPIKKIKTNNQKQKINLSPNKININLADNQELQIINGIGPKMAESIITTREKNGKFNKIEDLLNVKGIGPKKLEKIKNFIEL